MQKTVTYLSITALFLTLGTPALAWNHPAKNAQGVRQENAQNTQQPEQGKPAGSGALSTSTNTISLNNTSTVSNTNTNTSENTNVAESSSSSEATGGSATATIGVNISLPQQPVQTPPIYFNWCQWCNWCNQSHLTVLNSQAVRKESLSISLRLFLAGRDLKVQRYFRFCFLRHLVQKVLAEKEWLDKMQPEDFRGLTPLFYGHVNPYGRLVLNMNERIIIE